MLTARLKKTLENRTEEVSPEIREEFFTRMDPDYFARKTPDEIAQHLAMIASLTPSQPVGIQVHSMGDRRYRITLAAYDYFSEFAIFCGHLASSGFNIEAGEVYTYGGNEGSGRKRIIDLFEVRELTGSPFDEERQKQFINGLTPLLRLLDEGKFREARGEVNRHWVEHLTRRKQPDRGLLYPIDIRFDNLALDRWTVMEIRSVDTPGFLFALSNALSLRSIYIKRVDIRGEGEVVRDRFILRDRHERRLGKTEQETLRAAVALIKQFMHYLIGAPDPALALHHFDLLIDRVLQEETGKRGLRFLGREETLDLLARVLGTSNFLWEDFLRMQAENLLPLLKDFRPGRALPGRETIRRTLRREMRTADTVTEKKARLNHFKDREIFRIDMAHLADARADLTRFSADLTDLAEAVLEEAYRVCRDALEKRYGVPRTSVGKPVPLSVLGLGKFGGREMGYASDIELMLIYGEAGKTDGKDRIENRDFFERLAAELLKFIEAKRDGIFQIDLRLRPYGSKGALAVPFPTFSSYFSPSGASAPFERQALIKLRWAAGDRRLGKRAEAHRDLYVYSAAPWDLSTAIDLRRRQIRELVPPGRVNAKHSPGGIIDIEYAAQYLQILYGATHSSVRTPSTLDALDRLAKAGLLRTAEKTRLRESYLFLRRLIDALRIVRGNAKDLLLPDPDSEEFTFLARRLGFLESPWKKGRERLRREIEKQMGNARRFYESLSLNPPRSR